MNTTKKEIRIVLNISYLENKGLKVKNFLNSYNLRNFIVLNILEENFNFNSFKIINIFFLNNVFYIDINIEIYLTTILKFNTLKDALLFCIYINNPDNYNDINNNNNNNIQNTTIHLSLYNLKNNYYLIIENNFYEKNEKLFNTYTIKLSDFNKIKFTPLIYSIITENGFKLST